MSCVTAFGFAFLSSTLSSSHTFLEQLFRCDKLPKKFNTSAKYRAPVGGMVAHCSLLESGMHQGQKARRAVIGYRAVLKQRPRGEEAQSRKLELRCQWETRYKLNSCAGKGTYQHLLCCSLQSSTTRDHFGNQTASETATCSGTKSVDTKYITAKRIQINL